MENTFKKIDILLALIIGEVAALLMVLIAGNLTAENQSLVAVMSYSNYFLVFFPIACAVGLYIAYKLSKIISIVYQFAKFVLVGGMNFLIDMGVLNFLIFTTGISAGFVQSGFKAISFLVATTNSYVWNKKWTFKRDTNESVGKEFFQFLAVSVIGLLINLGVDYVLVNMISPIGGMGVATWAQFSAMMASIVALFWNFIGYKFIVFDEKKNEQISSIS